MEIMTAKVEKHLRNGINRRVNCDAANLDKTVDAAQEQLAAIRKLGADRGLSLLPDRLRETAEKRLEFPELTLSELAAALDPPVTKSCLQHRLKRLMTLAGQSDT
jgi:DNA-binding protein WhiA